MVNIYVPEKFFNEAQIKLPVMAWFHGGGLVFGSNNYIQYGPQHFMDKGVVMVSINYRLGQWFLIFKIMSVHIQWWAG